MDAEHIFAYIVGGTLAFSLLLFVIVMFVAINNKKRKEERTQYELDLRNKELRLLKIHIETQESERERIARNLHDEVNPLISSLKLHMSKHEKMLERNELKKDDLVKERKYVDDILQQMRIVEKNLSPRYLLRNGLNNALISFLLNLPDIKTTINEVNPEQTSIPHELGINFYRIFLELTTNLLRHDNPKTIHLDMITSKNDLLIKLTHDGTGITNDDFANMSEASTGLGLTSLKSRTTIVNGSLDFQIEPTATITFKAPL